MAIDRTPVLKRCRSLGLTPAFLGISKESHRQAKRANRKKSKIYLWPAGKTIPRLLRQS